MVIYFLGTSRLKSHLLRGSIMDGKFKIRYTWAKIYNMHLQLLGCLGIWVCFALFVSIHCSMGHCWSPVPESKKKHQLITTGLFRFARHPMYAVLMVTTLCFGLATLNWLVAVCSCWMNVLWVIRIPQEERILIQLFGYKYLEYSKRVGMLGPKCLCFWERVDHAGELSKKKT